MLQKTFSSTLKYSLTEFDYVVGEGFWWKEDLSGKQLEGARNQGSDQMVGVKSLDLNTSVRGSLSENGYGKWQLSPGCSLGVGGMGRGIYRQQQKSNCYTPLCTL